MSLVSGDHRPGAYDLQPTVPLPPGERVRHGADAWRDVAAAGSRIVLVDAYPGTNLVALHAELTAALPDWRLMDVERAARPIAEIDRMIAQNLTDDRVFGVLSHQNLPDFYDGEALATLARQIAALDGPVIVTGWGAALLEPLLAEPVTLVLADLARWEIQLRQRAGAPNWHCDNGDEDPLRKYKRGFFVEWRVADRHKRGLFDRVDFVYDSAALAPARARPDEPGMITGAAFRGALAAATEGPFRLVPFFDPGVWGGQWMKQLIDLDRSERNYAWCFDCVPEENSLLLEGDGGVVEIPALDLVLTEPRRLLGQKTFARFGAEFPIRFDFLDTMEGGNLSLQVHPLTDYIQNTFGMHYTQDESYYLLDAEPGAVVYLGLREGVDPDAMIRDLEAAQAGDAPFPAERYVNTFPARKHDHFAIPAGTVHSSGANSMVLEISATPFIFTFKLWDWGRVGLDGRPRPVHLEHGVRNIQWNRDTAWTRENLVGRVELIAGDGPDREERTGLHELEFIEVRRHWFTASSDRHTDGTVHVLNLVEGDEARVVSPTAAFAPFLVHYAETFVVPAAVGAYRLERTAASRAESIATVTAYVRGTRNSDDRRDGDESP